MTTNENLKLKKEKADVILEDINSKYIEILKIKENCDELIKKK